MLKRSFDFVGALVGLIVTSPMLVVIACALALSPGGPVLYRAQRVGMHGRPFTMYKFRTMAGHDTGPRITIHGDLRITRLGRLLRATKLDELPQLVNVVLGDMSLVGPRPEDPRYVALYDEGQRRVLSMRPGMTGPTAIAYRHEERILARAVDPEKAYVDEVLPAKLAIDLDYVEDHSFPGDLRILVQTIAAVFRRGEDAGAVEK